MKWIIHLWAHVRDVWSYRHEPEHLRVLAGAYWHILLITVACGAASVALYGGLQFLSVRGMGEKVVGSLPSGVASTPLNQKELQATLEGFDARKERYEFLRTNRPEIADPSK